MEMTIYNPNTSDIKVHKHPIQHVHSPSLFASAVKQSLDSKNLTDEKQSRIDLSLKYGILDRTTAMFAQARISTPSGKELETVNIPMHAANNIDSFFSKPKLATEYEKLNSNGNELQLFVRYRGGVIPVWIKAEASVATLKAYLETLGFETEH